MSGHGWVYPNPNGLRARCGGPGLCPTCATEYVQRYGAHFNQTVVPDMEIATAKQLSAANYNPPMGCICPPTSERTCESPICPRKNPFKGLGA